MAFRLDRLATLYVSDPVQRLRSDSRIGIPVLMYHSISEVEESEIHPYYRTVTPPVQFERQLAYLRENNYAAIAPADAAAYLNCKQGAPSKSVVITFDDGFLDFYEQAFPLLTRYGLFATVYLPTAYITQNRTCFKARPCMTWTEVREVHNHGILFGSHTVTHPQLYSLDERQITAEVGTSKDTIEQNLGSSVESFAYPYAFPETDARFKQLLRTTLLTAGYANGVCTTIGRAQAGSDPLFMKRLPVSSGDDLRLFAAKLAGSYDWISKPQYWVKLVKQWVDGHSGKAGISS